MGEATTPGPPLVSFGAQHQVSFLLLQWHVPMTCKMATSLFLAQIIVNYHIQDTVCCPTELLRSITPKRNTLTKKKNVDENKMVTKIIYLFLKSLWSS